MNVLKGTFAVVGFGISINEAAFYYQTNICKQFLIAKQRVTELTLYLPALSFSPTRGMRWSAAIRSLGGIQSYTDSGATRRWMSVVNIWYIPRRHAVNHIRGLNLSLENTRNTRLRRHRQ